MLKRTWSFLTLIIVVSFLLAACGSETATPTVATTPATATTAGGTTAATATTASAAPTATTGGATTAATATTGTSAGAATATSAPAGATGTAAGGTSGGKLVRVTGAGGANAVRNFNPFSQTAMFCSSNCALEPLLVINTVTGEIVPWLATAYKLSDDAKTLTFTIRDGVLWSDGQPFSASDVAFTFNLLRDKAGLQGPAATAMNAKAGYVDTVTAPDPKTVVFTFKQPFSLALYDLAGQQIVPEHIWKSIDDPSKYTNENPVGTGPFTEVTNFSAAQYEVHRNPHYWQADKIAFDGFKVTQGLAPDAQNLAIVNGSFDWTGGSIPNIDQTYVAKDPQHRSYWNPTTGAIVALELLTTEKPFDDVNVRKAISMAINRKQIATVALKNATHPADVTGLSDGYAAWKVPDPGKLGNWTDYNPTQANQLLDAAGLKKGSDGIRTLPDGTKMQYDMAVVQGFPDFVQAGTIVVENLKAVGIAATAKPLSFGAFFQTLMMGNFKMSFGYMGGATPYQVYNSTMSAATTAPVGQSAALGNYTRYTSAKAADLLGQLAATTDPAKQKDLAVQLQQEFANDVPVLPLYLQPYWEIYQTTQFTGFPTKDNPYALGLSDGSNSNMLLVFQHLKPVQ